MRFRPCIDIHNGKVKQIVGGSLGADIVENFVSKQDAAYFATLYREKNLPGGHVIILDAPDSAAYEASVKMAYEALAAYPGGLQIGGGINAENAADFLSAGASHVIVTSYVFDAGRINYQNLTKLTDSIGQKKLVLDLSCRKNNGRYYIVTNRWQRFTKVALTPESLGELAAYCDEFLIHGVDVEGKMAGPDVDLLAILSAYAASEGAISLTYAGGVRSLSDIEKIKAAGLSRMDLTIGSALDIFGGPLKLDDVLLY